MNLIIPLSDNIIIISQDFTNNKSPLFSTKHRIILLSFTARIDTKNGPAVDIGPSVSKQSRGSVKLRADTPFPFFN